VNTSNGAGSMTKAELVEEVSRVSDLTKKHSEVIVDTVFRAIIEALHRGEKIELRGFGSFRLRKREPRKGRNPKTGDKVDVPPKKVPYFKPGKELKELINREEEAAERLASGNGSEPSGPALVSRAFVDRLWSPWRLAYVTGNTTDAGCVFCRAPRLPDSESLILSSGTACYVVLNLYPYNNGHVMVVPYRHVATLAALTPDELHETAVLTQRAEIALTEAYQPHGINVGINIGKPAGAGVLDHVHVHLVPRWNGDTNFMTVVGNVRVLPEDLGQSLNRLRPIFDRLASNDTNV
jgi:ATP adenylyltransferase